MNSKSSFTGLSASHLGNSGAKKNLFFPQHQHKDSSTTLNQSNNSMSRTYTPDRKLGTTVGVGGASV